ncbi:MAG: type II and III secretion system protein family protein [Longimicrobiales bacterium]|nr:type II and III secretion system protein family protein [Longimicrobiales bacterium]
MSGGALRSWIMVLALAAIVAGGSPVSAQAFLTEPDQAVSLARGTSIVHVSPVPISRISMADAEVAEAVVMSPTEVLINGKALGTTTFMVWDEEGRRHIYVVEVTADAGALARHLTTLYPDESIDVAARGNSLILSGEVTSAFVARRALELAEGTGAVVINNLQTPAPAQILLQVRFAEVSHSALKRLGNQVLEFLNPDLLTADGDWRGSTDSDGAIELSLINTDAHLRAIIRALEESGDFKSLAEPNLLALDGEEASFLAGGEFPYPTVQGGQVSDAITIEWREFGVRLNFTPTVTNIGNINLAIAPEVSSLDFAGGLVIAGFQIPTILTRRAATQVELREGQHLAIAGLMDRSIQENVRKLPLLGDIPILGALFRTTSERQDLTELLVIVSPRIVEPSDQPLSIPTGEPETWDWVEELAPQSGDTVPAPSGQTGR